MESTRSGKKKKSPKSRHKRGKKEEAAHHSSNTNVAGQSTTHNTQQQMAGQTTDASQPKDSETSEQPAGPEVLPTPPPSEVTSPTDDQDLVDDVIATTPVAHGVTVVDIQQQFQVGPLCQIGYPKFCEVWILTSYKILSSDYRTISKLNCRGHEKWQSAI